MLVDLKVNFQTIITCGQYKKTKAKSTSTVQIIISNYLLKNSLFIAKKSQLEWTSDRRLPLLNIRSDCA